MTTHSQYHLLGRSGLRVSPLCLGAMTFGEDWGWGAPEKTVNAMMSLYLERGGNFIDTADLYTNGTSEKLVGKFIKETHRRDKVVLATKASFSVDPSNPNGGGNGRKHIRAAVEESLRRLQTDYIDLYWIHAWDSVTTPEEILHTLDQLVRDGKIRYFGLSDCPAWFVSQAQTTARLQGREPFAGMQLEYSLLERSIESEHVPLALHQGLGICAWSPLAFGLLSGKYTRNSFEGGRLKVMAASGDPQLQKFGADAKHWEIVEAVKGVAAELGKKPAQVALNWITKRPGIAATIVGASKLEQLEDNMAALDFDIPEPLRGKLEEASRPPTVAPHWFFTDFYRRRLNGQNPVVAEPAWFRPRLA